MKTIQERIAEYNPVKYYLENELEDREVHLWDEELKELLHYAKRFEEFKNNIGVSYDRTQFNEREKAFADNWMLQNKPVPGLNYGLGTLQDLFVSNPHPQSLERRQITEKITDRDRMIVATVIQWLGTNCGMGFLSETVEEFGYVLKPKEK